MRIEGITDEELLKIAAQAFASKGGNARVAKMTPAQHSAHGKKMVAARELKRLQRKELGE